jgi:hypothetical protein
MSFEEDWTKVAVNAIMYQVSRDENVEDSELEFDQWLLYAIGELPQSQMSSRMVDHAMRSVRLAVDNQSGEDQDEEALDQLGVFYNDLSVTTTATHTEGLCAVYHLAVEQGRNQEVAKIIDAVTLGLRHQLQTQFQPEHAMYMRNPKRILGGFHENIIDTHMRLDYTYHNVCSLLCAADMLADWENKAELSTE